MRLASTLAAGSMLAACALPAPPPAERVPRLAPANLLTRCEAPEEPAGAAVADLLVAFVETAGRLHECRARHEALAAWAEEAR